MSSCFKFVGSPKILVVIQNEELRNSIEEYLNESGCIPIVVTNVLEAIPVFKGRSPELVIIGDDIRPLSWKTISREINSKPEYARPVLLLRTSEGDSTWEEIREELLSNETGVQNDFLVAPVDQVVLAMRIRGMLRMSHLQRELEISNSMLKELTLYLDNMVEEKVKELEGVSRLRRFFAPQLAEAIVSEDETDILDEHRGVITVVFLDLRRFTGFADRHTPRDVIAVVRQLHECVGPIIFKYGGTLERFTGDGMMVFLGDPKPMPDHAFEAVRMALHIQHEVKAIQEQWTDKGYDLSLGIGIATGEATMGSIGFEGRYDYAAIGPVTNMAARLCGKAGGGEILVSDSTYQFVKGRVVVESCGVMELKGFAEHVAVYSVKKTGSG